MKVSLCFTLYKQNKKAGGCAFKGTRMRRVQALPRRHRGVHWPVLGAAGSGSTSASRQRNSRPAQSPSYLNCAW